MLGSAVMGATNADDQNANNLAVVSDVLSKVANVAENVSDDLIGNTAGIVSDIAEWPPEVLEKESSL